VAVGRLILDSLGAAPGTQFYFSGTGSSNAIYVDYLELRDQATNRDNNGNVKALDFNSNLVIYYAQAIVNGISLAHQLNHKTAITCVGCHHMLGVYSSTNLVYPPGVTNTVNAALAQDSQIDSDGDGLLTVAIRLRFFVPAQMNFTMTLTNVPPVKGAA